MIKGGREGRMKGEKMKKGVKKVRKKGKDDKGRSEMSV